MSRPGDPGRELDGRLVVENKRFCSAGFAALLALSRLAQSDDAEQRDRAPDLAAVITRTLHRSREDDDLVRTDPQARSGLHSRAAGVPWSCSTNDRADTLVHACKSIVDAASRTALAEVLTNALTAEIKRQVDVAL